MKKNIDKMLEIKTALKEGIVRGIKVEHVPVPGMGVIAPSGSDSYGYTVGQVAEDGSWFTYGKDYKNGDGWVMVGYGVLVTRKGGNGRGTYRKGYFDKGGKLRPEKMDCVHVRCSGFGSLVLTGKFSQPGDYWDLSF